MDAAEKINREELTAVEAELKELESLISLQRRKVDLLRKKSEILGQNTSSKSSSQSIESENERPSVISPMQVDAGSPKGIQRLFQSRESFFFGARPQDSQKSGTGIDPFESFNRMNRLSTDLANERSMLAWTRTALAAIRTALSTLSVSGRTEFGDIAVKITSIGFAVIGLWTMTHGHVRYRMIKNILAQADPPRFFRRLSNNPHNITVIAVIILVVIAQASSQWTKS
mmetsp:Transcript_4559/g.7448  ORF Transcript_4559/g.7448 Transcript_4559/m.7448 type:complete len:228 (+) Transcript_4559:82-765(+)|eukprot:CAMPEP_0174992038 /NCGR_PEP_ID=MMETSP0004_2-20121128/22279_1 /TAXON_ID=420556 /ORGANISM="Ochromonas sp., Strain CCMP1393" /LENGTH=227 /DNA_ID=CAMNT_0016245961 /DNA_START=26 /DNA_END=709 /DNA_ORIENTATION=+